VNSEFEIVPEKMEFIARELDRIQVGCSARLLSHNEIKLAAEIAESLVATIIGKQNMQNICAFVTPDYGIFSPYYRGKPEQTSCLIRRGAKYWSASNFKRTEANRKGSCRVTIDLNSLRPKIGDIYGFVTSDLSASHVIKPLKK
jgi:hypothetical protein